MLWINYIHEWYMELGDVGRGVAQPPPPIQNDPPPTNAYVCLPVYYQYNVAKIGLEYYYYGSNVPLFWWSDMRIPGLNSQLLKNGLKKEECNCNSGAELIMVFFFQQLYKNMGLEYFQVQHKKAIFEVLTMKH